MSSCCPSRKPNSDIFLWSTSLIIAGSYLSSWQNIIANTFTNSIFELLNTMAWGICIGIVFVGVLHRIPQKFIISLLGKGGSFSGILRATGAGVLLDLCSHGILMVGMQLYKKGASLGQVMAFLIASPWNSFSLTLILWALIGFKWMMAFLLLSMLIAIISGLIFERLVSKKVLPENPYKTEIHAEKVKLDFTAPHKIILNGLKESKPVLRWVFFGVILASLIRTFVSPEHFEAFFGPSLVGLGMTVLIATILEVCSEGSTPIAADLLTRAHAPGNSFAFLMTGVSTDYTEIMSLKDTTQSWKIALFLPLITLPQILLLAWMMNA